MFTSEVPRGSINEKLQNYDSHSREVAWNLFILFPKDVLKIEWVASLISYSWAQFLILTLDISPLVAEKQARKKIQERG